MIFVKDLKTVRFLVRDYNSQQNTVLNYLILAVIRKKNFSED